ncbi:MAG: hypothetical protein GXO65_01415 [Euryarchaeota archaeon]|nr:hypothetical protein [Euryarchaeota archaeon]
MRLAVDTNVLFSFFRKDSGTRRVILEVERFELVTLRSRMDELKKHKTRICRKANIGEEDFQRSMEEMCIFIDVVDDREVASFGKEAEGLSPHEEDVPLFALALAKECGIWSNEVAFKNQSRLKVYSTSDLMRGLEE